MSDRVVLREMTPADVLAMSAVVTDCYRFLAEQQSFTTSQRDDLLELRADPGSIEGWLHHYRVMVAIADRVVVGVVATAESELEELFVAPSHHRQGIGSRLFAEAEETIRRAGFDRLMVNTTGYGSPFYEAMGAPIVGTILCPYGPLVGRTIIRHAKLL